MGGAPARMHARIAEWSRVYSNNEKNDSALKALSTWGLERFKGECIPTARVSDNHHENSRSPARRNVR